jgi:hypothetical protein
MFTVGVRCCFIAVLFIDDHFPPERGVAVGPGGYAGQLDGVPEMLPGLFHDEGVMEVFPTPQLAQAWEDHRDASAEGSDNLSKASAESHATEKAMRDRFPDYQNRYKARYP